MLAMAGERGADRVTTRALADRLGVTEPVLYRHFPGGKTEMWRALATHVGEHMQAAWGQAVAEAEDGAVNRLRALVRAQLRTIAAIPALPGILFSRTLHRDNAALRAAIGELVGGLHGRITQIIAQGCADGDLPRDLEPDAAAWLLVSVVQGTAIRWSLSEHAFDLEREGLRVLNAALGPMQRGSQVCATGGPAGEQQPDAGGPRSLATNQEEGR